MPPFRRLIFFLEFILFRFMGLLVNLMPISFMYSLNEVAGRFVYQFLGQRRKIAIDNIRRAFGNEKPEKEIEEIARESLVNLFHVVTEFVRSPQFLKNPHEHMNLKGWEHVEEALKKKKGIVLLAHHFENWEVSALAPYSMDCVMHAIARPLKNPYVYRYIKDLRENFKLKVIDKRGAIRATMKLLKQNQVVIFLIDQHERESGVWVDFLGRPACTSSIPARLAMKTDASVICVFYRRDPPARFVVEFQKSFELIRSGNSEQDVQSNTEMFLKPLEEEIRKKPQSWLWMHRRWRKPPAEVEAKLSAAT